MRVDQNERGGRGAGFRFGWKAVLLHDKGVCFRRKDFAVWLAAEVKDDGHTAQQVLEKIQTNLRRLGCDPDKMKLEVKHYRQEYWQETSVALYRVPESILQDTEVNGELERKAISG